MTDELRPYQRDAIAWLLDRPRALLADQPGLGKTAQILHTHAAFAEQVDGAGLVIVCPKSAKSVWRSEIAKWGIDVRVTVLAGGDSWRWPEPGEAVILNPAILPWTASQVAAAKTKAKLEPDKKVKIGPAIAAVDYPVHLVLDECQAYRKRDSLQSIRVKALGKKCAKVTGATGTPIGGSPFDLYGMLRAIGCCPWEWFDFLRRFNAYELPHGGHDFQRDASGHIIVDPRVHAELAAVMLRRQRVDVAKDLPPKLYREIDVDHKRAIVAELDRLALTCAPYFDRDELPPFTEFASVYRAIADERIPLIEPFQIEREDLGQVGLIVSAHRAPVERAGARGGWGAIHGGTPEAERERLIAAFESGQLRGLAIVLKTAATAISLPTADYVLFVDRSWDPDENEQAEDRPNRMNRTKGPIEIETSAHPVSRHLARVLAIKKALGSTVLRELPHV